MCPKEWTYHDRTATCIRKFDPGKYFSSAKTSCEGTRGGPSGNEPGWLVGIHDRETNNFVKNLLDYNQKAYIGLYNDGNGLLWLDKTQISNMYDDWRYGHPKTSYYHTYRYVVITKGGWENLYSNNRFVYFCQQYPSFSLPTLTCGAVEEGKAFPQLYCTYPTDNTIGDFLESKIQHKGNSFSMECNSNFYCRSSTNLTGRIFDDERAGTVTTEVSVSRPVTREDNGQWSCWYKFQKTPDNLLVSHCTMATYKMPHTVDCSYTFPGDGGFLVVCKISGSYPKFSSKWWKDDKWLGKREGSHREIQDEGISFYDTSFQRRFTTIVQGTQKITVSMYPKVKFYDDQAKKRATRKETVEVTISLPDQPPVFSTENNLDLTQGVLTVSPGQNIILICEVDGGRPQVSQTYIQCDGTYVRDISGKTYWGSAGQKVSAELSITRSIDQKVCTCKAQHVTKEYKKTTSLTFNVPHAAEVFNFKVNQVSKEITVSQGARVKFRCHAYGNPTPSLHLYKIESDGKTHKTLLTTFNTSLAYDVAEVSCDMSGIYVCSAENSLNKETSEKRVLLKVRCPPQPCSQGDGDRQFSIIPRKAFNFQVCLFVYPEPHSEVRISPKGKENLDGKDCNANFIYTNALGTKGNVVVNMSSSVTKHGNYTMKLYQSKWHEVEFSLVPYLKPSCPESLNTTMVGSRFLILSWQPAFDGGIPQTFIVYTINSMGVVVNKNDIGGNREVLMSHNVTNLNPGSVYSFKLTVKNAQGVTECPHLLLNVTTQALPVSAERAEERTGDVLVWAIIAVLIVIIAIVLFAILFLVKRRKGNKQPKMPIWLRRGKKESKKMDEVPTFRTASKRSQRQPSSDIYSKVNKPKKKFVEMEESVYSNNAAIELHNQHQSVTYTAHGSSEDSDHPPPVYCDWSDADDSKDDLTGGAAAIAGPSGQFESNIDHSHAQRTGEDLVYVNVSSAAGTNKKAAMSGDTSTITPKGQKRHKVPSSGVVNVNFEDTYCNSVEMSPHRVKSTARTEGNGETTDEKLVYIQVKIDPSQKSEDSFFHPMVLTRQSGVEDPVDYASLNYDAGGSDSGTAGGNHL